MSRTMINLVNLIEGQFPAVGKRIWQGLYDFLAWRFPLPPAVDFDNFKT
ncbi:MAG: hypothetical protein QNJ65_03990 [Xenococcaceae cyanobacterium MO_234.B1]|nr:hypothetical protein [Xenococcaceae cyanobacterium MO_234.B1]